MNLTYLNLMYFLYYQKFRFLYNDVQSKKPIQSPVLSLYPHLYNLKLLTPYYSDNIIMKTQVNTNVNTHVNTYVNKYIKNKLL